MGEVESQRGGVARAGVLRENAEEVMVFDEVIDRLSIQDLEQATQFVNELHAIANPPPNVDDIADFGSRVHARADAGGKSLR